MDQNIQKYMAFVKTVECGSFTIASQMLNYSQSGISRMIHDLETEWDVTLLERSRSGIRLTSDGTQLLPYARKLCDEYEGLRTKVNDLHGMEAGIIRIGTISSVATHWLPNIIREFKKDYPKIEYELLLGDYMEIEGWIQEHRVDCGFLRIPTRNEFDTIFLEQDRLLAVLPENHLLAENEKVSVKELEQYPFLLLEKNENIVVSDIFKEHGIFPRIAFTTWDDYAIMSMVESGFGISILPELILRRIPYHIVLRELETPHFRKIGVALDGKPSLAVRKFLQYLEYR